MDQLVKGFVTVAMIASIGATAIMVGRWAYGRTVRSSPRMPASAMATVTVGAHVVRAEVARTAAERERGLSGHAPLAPDAGMLFVFDIANYHAIWMPGMRFSIDVIWIAGGVVVDTTERLPMPKPGETVLPLFHPSEPALLVLEVPAGTVAERGIARGDRVAVTFDGN